MLDILCLRLHQFSSATSNGIFNHNNGNIKYYDNKSSKSQKLLITAYTRVYTWDPRDEQEDDLYPNPLTRYQDITHIRTIRSGTGGRNRAKTKRRCGDHLTDLPM